MKNKDIVTAFENLASIMTKKEKYPVKFSYAITRNFKKLKELMEDFEVERNKLLDKYNMKSENGIPTYKEDGKVNILKEHEENWKRDIGELLDIEVEFKAQTVSLESLPENIEPGTLYSLDFMIEE